MNRYENIGISVRERTENYNWCCSFEYMGLLTPKSRRIHIGAVMWSWSCRYSVLLYSSFLFFSFFFFPPPSEQGQLPSCKGYNINLFLTTCKHGTFYNYCTGGHKSSLFHKTLALCGPHAHQWSMHTERCRLQLPSPFTGKLEMQKTRW